MGRKNVTSKRILGYTDISNVAQGGGYITISSTTTTEVINVSEADNISLHLQWRSSTLVATVSVQARNGDAAKDDWRSLDFGSPIPITGTSGEHDIEIVKVPFTDLRVIITVASGSGQVGLSFVAKNLGA